MKHLLGLLAGLVAILIVFVGISALRQYKEYKFVGAGLEAVNTISVSGEGEVAAVPDVAIFTITVREEAPEAKFAQTAATDSMNEIISYLEDEGIEEKDVKTQSYDIHPKYEWIKDCALFDAIGECDRKRTLTAYEVSQSLRVKVRDTDNAGEVLAGIGARGVDNVSGLSFEIDDDDALRAKARREAIADAKRKAKVLAKDLGVQIVRVANFSEGASNKARPMYARMEMAMMDSGGAAAPAPKMPMGENIIKSNVTITYEIR